MHTSRKCFVQDLGFWMYTILVFAYKSNVTK